MFDVIQQFLTDLTINSFNSYGEAIGYLVTVALFVIFIFNKILAKAPKIRNPFRNPIEAYFYPSTQEYSITKNPLHINNWNTPVVLSLNDPVPSVWVILSNTSKSIKFKDQVCSKRVFFYDKDENEILFGRYYNEEGIDDEFTHQHNISIKMQDSKSNREKLRQVVKIKLRVDNQSIKMDKPVSINKKSFMLV